MCHCNSVKKMCKRIGQRKQQSQSLRCNVARWTSEDAVPDDGDDNAMDALLNRHQCGRPTSRMYSAIRLEVKEHHQKQSPYNGFSQMSGFPQSSDEQ